MVEFLSRREFERFREDVIEPMKERMEHLSTKKDLDYQTVIINNRIDKVAEKQIEAVALAKEELTAKDKKAAAMRWLIGLLVMIALAGAKKLGWL
jgi:hypothetical protein